MRWLLCGVVACAGLANAWADGESLPKKTFAVERANGFKPVSAALDAYLVKHEAAKGSHSLCVIGYVEPRNTESPSRKVARVHWREGNRLTLWEPAAKGFESRDTLIRSRRHLDLAKDVAATAEAASGSTYLVSRAWIDAIDRDCKRRGKTYSIVVR
jgi:hypothetical protein